MRGSVCPSRLAPTHGGGRVSKCPCTSSARTQLPRGTATSDLCVFEHVPMEDGGHSMTLPPMPPRAQSVSGRGGGALRRGRRRAGQRRARRRLVRKTPSWPGSGAISSPLSLCSHRKALANLRILGQPNTLFSLLRRRNSRPPSLPLDESDPCERGHHVHEQKRLRLADAGLSTLMLTVNSPKCHL
jgi:hypothetical protein